MHRNSRVGRTQRGNILFLILLAVVLFAALSYAVTSSMRGGGKDGGSESANLKAAQIIQYATLIEASWQRLRLRGCGIDQISFEHPDATAAGLLYANSRAPSNKSCHMFDPAGGGVTYQSFEDDFLVAEQTGNTDSSILWSQRGHFRFVGSADHSVLSGVPDDDPAQVGDTVIIFPLIIDSVCVDIGEQTTDLNPRGGIALWSGHLLSSARPHRTYPAHLDVFTIAPEQREGCTVNGAYSGGTEVSRTSYWRIISVN